MEPDVQQRVPDVREEATAVDIGERVRVTPWHHLAGITRRAEVMVGAGALLGVYGRWEVGVLAKQYLPAPFPYGTLIVNLVGCLVIGIVQTLFLDLGLLRRETQLFAVVGLCGGFTTFSTFSVETAQLVQAGHVQLALWYQALSLIGGLITVALGSALVQAGHRLLAQHPRRLV